MYEYKIICEKGTITIVASDFAEAIRAAQLSNCHNIAITRRRINDL